MGPQFDVRNWFWIVAVDETRAWSSAAGAYVTEWPDDQVTRIISEDELSDVLRPYGLTVPKPTEIDYQSAIQALVDGVAKAKNYTDGTSLAGYVASTNADWAAEAATFIAWRDQVWTYAYGELAKVQTGQRPQPTVATILSELPASPWAD